MLEIHWSKVTEDDSIVRKEGFYWVMREGQLVRVWWSEQEQFRAPEVLDYFMKVAER